MAADSARFQRLDSNSDTKPFAADDYKVDVAGKTENNQRMELSGGQSRFFAITRRHLIIGVIVVVVVVLVLAVAVSVASYHTVKSKGTALQTGQDMFPLQAQSIRCWSDVKPTLRRRFDVGPTSNRRQCSLVFPTQKWSIWSDWGPCSVTCGTGTQRRSRTCVSNSTCDGDDEEMDVCVGEDCNDDMWLNWSEWNNCQNVSGVCKKSRSRSCHNTALKIKGGRCVGNGTQDLKCKKDACHANIWADWQVWTDCSSNCDFGVKTRERVCTDGKQTVNSSLCQGMDKEKEWCHIIDCKDLDECLSNPCVRGTCVDKLKEYECVCEFGWHGENCEMMDTCASNPCVYGSCTNHDNGYNCTCLGSMGTMCEIPLYDCLDVKNAGLTETGVYNIRMKRTNETVDVLCDMDSQEGGWTVFQHRFNGSVNFYRTFEEYRDGFGSPYSEHWLGLHYIYELTQDPSMLNIELEAADGSRAYQIWQSFAISADPDYELDISDGSGTAGGLGTGIQYNNGNKFSAIGQDVSGSNCVEKDYGGWWFDNCAYANLNGYYAEPGTTLGYNGRQEAAMTYRSFKTYEALKGSSMMLRRNTI